MITTTNFSDTPVQMAESAGGELLLCVHVEDNFNFSHLQILRFNGK